MKKTISVLGITLIVFLCSSFPVFAVTGGGKTIVSNSYSYNNGDVTVFVRVNGQAAEELYEGQHYYPHNFTVTLANNTNEFQVADASNFSIDLYSGSATAFASNQNSWGADVESYSDNMTVPRITMYPSGDLAGHVIIGFNDSDLLVLNPNETRTYNFSINFIQTENINYTPLNGNYRYSYFTYTGTVGFYARPITFSSNTIEDFINNDSLPNSVIAYFQNLLVQGVEDQQLYQNIIDALHYSSVPDLSFSNRSTTLIDRPYIQAMSGTGYSVFVDRFIYAPYPVDRDVISSADLDDNISDYTVWCVPVIYVFDMRFNKTFVADYSYTKFEVSNPFYGYVGFDTEVFGNDFFNIINPIHLNYYLYSTSAADGYPNKVLYPEGNSLAYVKSYYYFVSTSGTTFTPTINTFTCSVTRGNTLTAINESYFAGLTRNLKEIINRIQSILDAYTNNSSYANDLNDDSDNLETELDNVHNQEQQWYSDNEAAIQATGLSNYQFSSSQISGLTAIRTQFSDIWDVLGDWNLIYIFTLLLSFATFILRHRPTTKAQQRTKEMSYNRSLQRDYYTSRMYDTNSGQGDLMKMALRKYK